MDYGSLQSAERNIVAVVALVHLWSGERECGRVSVFCEPVYYDSTRIAQVVVFRNLVECLSHAVVNGRAKNLKVVESVHLCDNAVSTAHKKPYVRILYVVFQMGRVHVSKHVVDCDERFFCRPCESFPERKSNKERTHKPRTVGCGNCVNLVETHVCLGKCLPYHRKNPFGVLAACNLRDNALVNLVEGNLCRHNVADYVVSVLNYGTCRLVAGAFNS